jgi:hypothetical protein
MTYYRVLRTWMVSQGSESAFQCQRVERSEKTGVWGRIPQETRGLTIGSFGPGWSVKAVKELSQCQRVERSEKTGVWGRIPRKHDDLQSGPSDLDGQSRQ